MVQTNCRADGKKLFFQPGFQKAAESEKQCDTGWWLQEREKEIMALNTIARAQKRQVQNLVPAPPGKPVHSNSLPQIIVQSGRAVEQHIREGRVQISFSLLTGIAGLFTGLEVLYEHLKGSYNQRIMYTPLFVCFALFIAGVWAAFSQWAARVVLRIVSLLTLIDGLVGSYFHIRGIQRKPGGWKIPIPNLVMGPPISAPPLLALVGVLGFIASLLRRETALPTSLPALAPRGPRLLPRSVAKKSASFAQNVRTGHFQRTLATLTALSVFFSGIEAFYFHQKNAFAYRIQWTPIITTPLLMAACFGAIWNRTMARVFLPLTSTIAVLNGLVGFFYHARGVRRRAAGTQKLFHNIMYGPPIIAPLMFSASGCVGLLASLLRREKA
jgi:hypothetical protein